MQIAKDLVAASSTPLVLGILADGESYGYAILRRVSDLSGGRLEWTDGMLYPLLHRLERSGHVEARWGTSETGRRRKYYRITAQGHRELAAYRRQWEVVDGTLRGIWDETASKIVKVSAELAESGRAALRRNQPALHGGRAKWQS